MCVCKWGWQHTSERHNLQASFWHWQGLRCGCWNRRVSCGRPFLAVSFWKYCIKCVCHYRSQFLTQACWIYSAVVRDEICRLQSTISWKMQWQINQGNTSMWGAQSGDFQLTQVRDNESKGLQWDWYFELILIESLECVVYWVGAAMNQQSRLTQENHNCNTHTHACMPLGTHTHLLIYRNTTH